MRSLSFGTRLVVGVGGIAMMAGAAYRYVTGEVDEYTQTQIMQLGVGGAMVLGAVVLTCIGPEPIVVTPQLSLASGPMWFRPGGTNAPVTVRASLTETPVGNRYDGGGTLRRAAATIDVFRDNACTVPLVFANNDALISHADLVAGLLLYVRGNAAGAVALTLTLDPTQRRNTTIQGPATSNVDVRAVNIIAPTITAEQLVLVHNNDIANPTTLSTVTLGYTESNAAYPCGDLRTQLNYGTKITCWDATNPATAYGSGTPGANLTLALLMKGQTAGRCKLTVRLSSASGATDPSWHIALPVSASVLVEKLEFDPYVYREGGASRLLGRPATRVPGVPKRRELHEQNGTNDFTLARVPIKRPSDQFWTRATHLTLTAGAGLQLFSDAVATTPAVDLQQTDFTDLEFDLWVKTTAVSPLEAQPALPTWVQTRNPEKDITARRIFCGATVGGRQLRYGDIVSLDAFGFDRQLDRRTGNAMNALLPGLSVNARNRQAALSMAGSHKYYDYFSASFVNHQHPAPHNGLWTAFCAAIDNAVGDNAAKAAAGTVYVRNYLQNTHGIPLHATMQGYLRAHIRRVLDANLGVWTIQQIHGTPGTHAEVLAVNALLATGLPAAEISVATYKLHPSEGQGQRFHACANCSGILLPLVPLGIRVITG